MKIPAASQAGLCMQQHLSCTGWLWPNRFYQSSSGADLETAEAAHRLVSERSEGWIIVVQVEMVTDALLPLVKMSPFGKRVFACPGRSGWESNSGTQTPSGNDSTKAKSGGLPVQPNCQQQRNDGRGGSCGSGFGVSSAVPGSREPSLAFWESR